MNKEFIPYEQALALKELGFDEPCFGKYLSSLQSDWKVYELILEMGMNEEFEDNRNVYFLEGACSAPTYSQVFRWFREKYELNKSILLGYDYSIENESKHWFSGTTEECAYKTYEEAELACLKKLIEIVKEK
jgi:hypothetical protein